MICKYYGAKISHVSMIMPTAHQQFLDHLFVELGDYIFVHAGLHPGIAVEAQSRQDLLWIREPFLSAPAPSRGLGE